VRPSFAAVLVLACLGFTVVLQGCGPTKVKVDTSPEIPKYRLESIAILPFESLATPQAVQTTPPQFSVPQGAKRSDINVAVPPASERLSPVTTTVPPHAAEKVTELFYEKLQARGDVRVIAPHETSRVKAEVMKDVTEPSQQELAKRVLSRLSADAVLVGRVLVYQERGGSKWGGEPASVGFEVKLLGPDGTTLWVGNYYERQLPMNQDLVGFFQHGGVFVTAEELAEYGVERLIKKFPFSGRPH
jgi:hypothetical protein